MNQKNSTAIWTVLIIVIIAALGAAWYFLWYLPHTPIYTLQSIRQGGENRDADTVLQHIDTTSLVKNIVTREGSTYVDTSSPLGKAAVAATKTFGPALLDDVIRKYVENPESFKSPPTNSTTKTINYDEKTHKTYSMIDRIQRGELFKQHNLEVKNITSIESDDTATVTITIQNNTLHITEDIRILMRHLGDGIWVIYDIPDIETLYKITRK